MDVIQKNQTWEQIGNLKNKEIIGVKWIYKIKFNVNGSILKNRAISC